MADALWSRVDRRDLLDCWLWTWGVGSHGYGQFSFRGEVLTAHVIAYRLTHGVDKPAGDVLHTCDVKRCCNPGHLYLGTQTDNNRDARERNRIVNIPRGENAPNVKLTEADVLAIRAEQKNARYGNRHYAVVAARYGIHPAMVYDIWRGRYWKHLQ